MPGNYELHEPFWFASTPGNGGDNWLKKFYVDRFGEDMVDMKAIDAAQDYINQPITVNFDWVETPEWYTIESTFSGYYPKAMRDMLVGSNVCSKCQSIQDPQYPFCAMCSTRMPKMEPIPMSLDYNPWIKEYLPTPHEQAMVAVAAARLATQGLRQAWRAGRLPYTAPEPVEPPARLTLADVIGEELSPRYRKMIWEQRWPYDTET